MTSCDLEFEDALFDRSAFAAANTGRIQSALGVMAHHVHRHGLLLSKVKNKADLEDWLGRFHQFVNRMTASIDGEVSRARDARRIRAPRKIHMEEISQ